MQQNNLKLKSGIRVKAQIWDTAGQERYLAITTAHYRRAIGAFVVYDTCKRDSFQNWEKWIKDVKSQADPEITIMLVGNKVDKATEVTRQVQKQEAEEFASKQNILFCETSALSDINVTSAFEQLLNKIDEVKIHNPDKMNSKIGLGLRGADMDDFEDNENGWSW